MRYCWIHNGTNIYENILKGKGRKMIRKNNAKNFNYFKAFINLSEYSLKSAHILINTLREFDREKLDERIKEMHEVEHSADLAKHDLLNRLSKEFLPPIEREDIVSLSEKIDDVTDFVEDVLLNINIFNVQTIPKEMLKFADVIMKCCDSMINLLKEFENFKKSKTLHNIIVEINHLEEVADEIYINELKKLFANLTDPVKMMIWKDLLDSMEKCCDACENVANNIENIVMKNS